MTGVIVLGGLIVGCSDSGSPVDGERASSVQPPPRPDWAGKVEDPLPQSAEALSDDDGLGGVGKFLYIQRMLEWRAQRDAGACLQDKGSSIDVPTISVPIGAGIIDSQIMKSSKAKESLRERYGQCYQTAIERLSRGVDERITASERAAWKADTDRLQRKVIESSDLMSSLKEWAKCTCLKDDASCSNRGNVESALIRKLSSGGSWSSGLATEVRFIAGSEKCSGSVIEVVKRPRSSVDRYVDEHSNVVDAILAESLAPR